MDAYLPAILAHKIACIKQVHRSDNSLIKICIDGWESEVHICNDGMRVIHLFYKSKAMCQCNYVEIIDKDVFGVCIGLSLIGYTEEMNNWGKLGIQSFDH
jgi:hypothetical protein